MAGQGMHLDMQIRQRLEQRQVLSLQTIQSLNILQLATADLQNLISDELLQNPTLDVADGDENGRSDVSAVGQAVADEPPAPKTESGETYEEAFEYLQRNTDIDDLSSSFKSVRARDDGEPDAKQEAFNNLAAPNESLSEHLLDQLRLYEPKPENWPLVEHIVYSLDARGYLEYPLTEIVTALKNAYTVEQAQAALKVVQSLEPRGVGARDLSECLLLQINETDPDYPHLRDLLTKHWDDVAKNRLPKIAKDMGVEIEDVKMFMEMLTTLNPSPGLLYSSESQHYIVPDVVVEENEKGEFTVRLTRENVPRLSLNEQYLRMLKDRQGDKATLNFVKSKITSARQLIEAINQRQSTLERVSNAIVKRQQRFLREGVAQLAPMKMQDIADELGIHHSTVWRAVYGKHVETPQGVLPLNSFFTGGMPSSESDGGTVSREAVKLKLKELCEGEDKRKPLSDMALSKKLADAGIPASRRVVTKYREEMGIADSRVRRSY
ncbi:MAG: RNA polymerase factor sigma-54 [Planctomycetes bacterium]|nr:RNA polymerase factor sigma-54 [Planctomycetota bacterium]